VARDPAVDPSAGDLPLGTRPFPFLIVLGGVIAAVIFLSTMLANLVDAGMLEGGPQLTQVPGVIGLDEASAVERLQAEGLEVTITTAQNVAADPGQIIGQKPQPGERVAAGSSVELVVSVGDDFTRVPELLGSPLDELFLMLAAYDLRIGEVTYREDDAALDEVLDQDPVAGELVERGSTVNLVLSSGPPFVEVPDVRNLPEAEAMAMLEEAGLQGVPEERRSFTVPRGHAMSTDPEAGEEAQRGSSIVVYISEGPPPTTRPPVTRPPTTRPPATPPPTQAPAPTAPPATQAPTPTAPPATQAPTPTDPGPPPDAGPPSGNSGNSGGD
jgi:eukaryotic-like serine/threonine-protein kinase